jgi:hypothetical protein
MLSHCAQQFTSLLLGMRLRKSCDVIDLGCRPLDLLGSKHMPGYSSKGWASVLSDTAWKFASLVEEESSGNYMILKPWILGPQITCLKHVSGCSSQGQVSGLSGPVNS